jgi:putative aldouronate transport system permease protein
MKGIYNRIFKSERVARNSTQYLIMLLPIMVVLAVFCFYPLAGTIIAFKDYNPVKGMWGSPWAGLVHFKKLFVVPNVGRVFFNTVYISLLKMIGNLIVPISFAVLLNEARKMFFRRSVQTIVYMPYFMSWVVLAGIFKDMFSPAGMVNGILNEVFNIEPIMFFARKSLFPYLLVSTDVWKNFGFNAIIFLAAITNINPELYESANVDGATRFQKIARITIPCLIPTTILVGTLSLQGILNAGFDQVFNMYNPLVYKTGDILDTYIYRMGISNQQYEFATAVGLLKSTIGLMLIITGQWMAGRFANYRIF